MKITDEMAEAALDRWFGDSWRLRPNTADNVLMMKTCLAAAAPAMAEAIKFDLVTHLKTIFLPTKTLNTMIEAVRLFTITIT